MTMGEGVGTLTVRPARPPLTYPAPSAGRKQSPCATSTCDEFPRSGAPVKSFVSLPLLCVLLGASSAGAQIFEGPPRRSAVPAFFLLADVGALQMQSVNDGRTGAVWHFGSSVIPVLHAGLAYALGSSAGIGLMAGYARAPFTYVNQVENSALCSDVCDAKFDIYSLALNFSAGGGLGLHQVLDANLGLISFSNLTFENGSTGTGSFKEDRDLFFSIGYGFGYGISPRLSIGLLQDVGLVIHQRENLPRDASSTVRQQTTRLMVRYAAGGRRTGGR